MGRRALLLGATGLVGQAVLQALLADPVYANILALVRRPLSVEHAKLETRVVDFEQLAAVSLSKLDDVFLCLGTTLKQAGSKERFRHVDFDYTIQAAELARRAGAARAALVSSVGANDSSSSFYLRVKGETEKAIEGLGFERVFIARPSFLLGRSGSDRSGESVGIAVAQALSWAMIGPLHKYRAIQATAVARSLVEGLRTGSGISIAHYGELSAGS